MQLRMIAGAPARVVECLQPITRLDDALDLIGACHEQDAHLLLIDSEILPEAFFDLRTRLAGELLQKFYNYGLTVAAVFGADRPYTERFEEFLSEARHGTGFRIFAKRSDAEAWLLEKGLRA